jgi:hypothetical protein
MEKYYKGLQIKIRGKLLIKKATAEKNIAKNRVIQLQR